MAITDHGIMQQSAVPLRISYAKIGAGNMYTYWWYYYPDFAITRTNLVSLNHDADTIIDAVLGPLGRPFVNFQHPDGLIYLGTYCSSSVAGKLASFNFVTGAEVELADTPATGVTPAQDGCLTGTWSDETNKRIFISTAITGMLWAYDPVTEGVENFGIIDDPGGTYNRYINSLQVDATHAYCAMKDAENSLLYLIKVTLDGGAETLVWKGDGATTIEVRRGLDEAIYVKKILSEVTTWYAITDFVNPITEPSVYGNNSRSTINYTGYSYDPNLAYPDGVGGYEVPFYYKRPGDSSFRLLTADLVTLGNYMVWRAGVDLDGNLICYADQYGPTTKFNTTTYNKTPVGVTGISGYSVGQDRQRRKLYFCGYPRGADYEYDPAVAWSLGTNPKPLTLATGGITDGRYTYHIHQGTDKLMWFGFDWIRNLGSDENMIAWYNPVAETTGYIDVTVPGVAVNLNTYNMENLAVDRSKSKLVFSGWTPTDALLAVIPVWKKGVSKYLRPIAGGATQGKIVNVGTSKATTNHFVGVTAGASYKTYCVDIGTGALIWGPDTNTGTSSFLVGAGPLFAHGYVWFFVGNDIMKLDPTTGTITTALNGAANGIVAGGLIWPLPNSPGEDSLYHWETASKKLFQIPKADLGI